MLAAVFGAASPAARAAAGAAEPDTAADGILSWRRGGAGEGEAERGQRLRGSGGAARRARGHGGVNGAGGDAADDDDFAHDDDNGGADSGGDDGGDASDTSSTAGRFKGRGRGRGGDDEVSQLREELTLLREIVKRREADELRRREEDLEFRRELARAQQRDMEWREMEMIQRLLDNRRREIDEKNEQLKSITSAAALISGFEVVSLVDLSLSGDSPEWLLATYAMTSATTACLMVFSLVSCSLIQVSTLRKFESSAELLEQHAMVRRQFSSFMGRGPAGHGGGSSASGGGPWDVWPPPSLTTLLATERVRFIIFWENSCEDDWLRAYRAFSLGIPLFLVNLALVSWVRFPDILSPGASVTAVCGFTVLALLFNHMKWGTYVSEGRSSQRAARVGGP